MPDLSDRSDPLPPAVARCLAGTPPQAGSFIVTIYGDVAEPRGGTLWMGTLIEVCAVHGISESLVRTAVSRLVAAGRLSGERHGRKSFYRLTPEARYEFASAARLIFAPPPPVRGWLFRFEAGEGGDPGGVGWAAAGSGAGSYAVAPDRPDLPRPGGLVFTASAVAGAEGLRDFAARHWPLDSIAAAYREFGAAFECVLATLADGFAPDGATALALRLRAVHAFRRVVLTDPRLPDEALPEAWPAGAARRLFAALYLRLADAADACIGRSFRDSHGPLAAATDATAARLRTLEAVVGEGE